MSNLENRLKKISSELKPEETQTIFIFIFGSREQVETGNGKLSEIICIDENGSHNFHSEEEYQKYIDSKEK